MSLSKRLRAAGYTEPHPLAGWKSDREWKATPQSTPIVIEETHVFDAPRPKPGRSQVRRSRLRRDDQLELPGFGEERSAPEAPTESLANGLAHHPDHHRSLLPDLHTKPPVVDPSDSEAFVLCALPGWVRIGRGFVTPAHMVPGPDRDRVEKFLLTASQGT